MSTPYGLSTPLYIHSGQSELYTPSFVEPYSASRVMHPPRQHFLWDSLAQQSTPGVFGSTGFLNAQPTSPMLTGTQAHYSTAADPDEDKDEFATFGTCVSVRGEQSAYDPMRTNAGTGPYPATRAPGSPDLLTTDVEDTLSNLPVGAILQADEEPQQQQVSGVWPNDQSNESEYTRLLREVEALRKQNMQLQKLQVSRQYGSAVNGYENGEDVDDADEEQEEQQEEVEEIIEEEIHTVKHSRPGPIVPTTSQREALEYVNKQHETIQNRGSRRRGLSNSHVNMQGRHVIDLNTSVIDESQFPPAYWSRLEELFRSRFETSRPVTRELGIQVKEVTHRTTATMATPLPTTTPERLCFGVSVCPSMQSVGVMCPRPATREFGCTPIETEATLSDWIENRLIGTNEATRKLVHKLFKSSMHNREEFLETVLRLVKRDHRHAGVQVQPEQRSQFAYTRGERLVSTASGEEIPMNRGLAQNTESKMVEARPTLANRSTLTRHAAGPSVACETESPLLRSQGAQAVPDVPDVTGCGIQVGETNQMIDQALDPIDFRTRRVAIGIQVTLDSSDTMFLTRSSEEEQIERRRWHSRSGGVMSDSEQTDARAAVNTASGVNKKSSDDTIQPDVSAPLGQERRSDHHQHSVSTTHSLRESSIDSAKTTPPKSTSIPIGEKSQSGNGARASESLLQSAPYWTNSDVTSESYTVSTERRMIDELSQRHLLPSDVDLDELTRGGQEALDAALARAKDLGTTHVVREFQPEVEVVHHVDDPIPPASYPFMPSNLSDSVFTGQAGTDSTRSVAPQSELASAVYQIPIMHSDAPSTSADSTGGSPRAIPVERASGLRSSDLTRCRTDSVGAGANSNVSHVVTSVVRGQDERPASTRIAANTSSGERSVTGTTTSQSHRTPAVARIPSRNHSFTMSTEALNACKILTDHYRNSPSGERWNAGTKEAELEKLRTIWFDLTSATKVELAKLQDFVAILHGHHEHLLRDVMQSVDDNGSTSLHYAVGHSAWAVVNLILDSGYGEPDRLNRAGFSPIMIATVCNVSDSAALRTLDRLFSAGNVNLRAGTVTRQTPLMLAAVNGSHEVLVLLLQHGAHVNAQDTSGNTALMFAIEHGDSDVISTLLDRPELNLSLRDNDGKNALDIAESKGNTFACEKIKRAMDRHLREVTDSTSTTTTTSTTVISKVQN